MYTHPSDLEGPADISNPSSAKAAAARRMTVYNTREGRPRWVLHMQAVFWRVLMGLGMFFHRLAPPRPPKPDYSRQIPSTISGKEGWITLNFYVPRDYDTQRRLWTEEVDVDVEVEGENSEGSGEDRSRDKGKAQTRRVSTISNVTQSFRRARSVRRWGGYPVVINFHGGGFTLGNAADDARWCGTVVNECHAVVISVDYRLAPECPFPTAVEDGVDSLLYVYKHADELGIDKSKIALSGFSSGGNMCFTVPLRLFDEMQGFPRDDLPLSSPPSSRQKAERAIHGIATLQEDDENETTQTASSSSGENLNSNDPSAEIPDPSEPEPPSPSPARAQKRNTIATITESEPVLIPSDLKLACLVPWYPPVDYTRTREQRRATCRRADQELPALFTDLFDESYLHPPHTISLDSPYLSPGVAPTSLLKNALPDEIIMHTCEWDMLLDEGEEFRTRLTSEEVGKHVWYKMVEGVPHGWDKAPNPWKPTPGVREHYLQACKEMRRVFGPEKGKRPPPERMTTKGWPTVAPRDSVNVVR